MNNFLSHLSFPLYTRSALRGALHFLLLAGFFCTSLPEKPSQATIEEIDRRIESIEALPETPQNELTLSTLRQARAGLSSSMARNEVLEDRVEEAEETAAEVQEDATRWQTVKMISILIGSAGALIGGFLLLRKFGVF